MNEISQDSRNFIPITLPCKFFFMACKYFTKAALLFAFTMISSSTLDAQKNDSLIQKRIRNQQFVFVPQSFSSPSVTMPIMTRDFELRVTTDSIIAILPFFGRSYTPQFGRSDDDGIKFISTVIRFPKGCHCHKI